MKKLLLIGVLALVGCGESTEQVEKQEPVIEQVVKVETEQVTEEVVNRKPVTKLDAKNYMITVESAVVDAKKFNPDVDMNNFKHIQKRYMELRDEGEKFEGSEFDNCKMLSMYPLQILHMKHGKNSIESDLKLYKQMIKACQRQINQAK